MRRLAFIALLPLLVLVTTCQNMSRSMSIASLSPSAGSTLGGTLVTIAGNNFPTSATPAVSFGGNPAVVASTTATQIVVTAPASTGEATESVNVTVTDSLGNTATRSNGYTYRSLLLSANKFSNDVSQFDVAREVLSLVEFATSPTLTGGAFPTDVRADQEAQLAFVANVQNTIGSFRYSFVDGGLTAAVGSPFTLTNGANIAALAVDPVHDLVFTANTTSNNVSSFAYDHATGVMTQFESELVNGLWPNDVAVDPALRLLFAVNRDSNTVSAFSYDALGDLVLVAAPTGTAGTKPVAIDIDTSSRLIFVALNGSSQIESFAYDAGGALTSAHVVGSQGGAPNDLAADASAGLLFVVNQDQTLKGFAVAANGTMTPAAGGSAGTGGSSPAAVVLDTSSGFIFVANAGASTIGLFSYAASGAITGVGSPADAGGTGPAMLAFIP